MADEKSSHLCYVNIFMIPSVCLSCLPEAFKSLSKSGIAQDSGGYDPEPH